MPVTHSGKRCIDKMPTCLRVNEMVAAVRSKSNRLCAQTAARQKRGYCACWTNFPKHRDRDNAFERPTPLIRTIEGSRAISLGPASRATSLPGTVTETSLREQHYPSAADICPIYEHADAGCACSGCSHGRSPYDRAPCRSPCNPCDAHWGQRSSHPGLCAFNRHAKAAAWRPRYRPESSTRDHGASQKCPLDDDLPHCNLLCLSRQR